MNKIYYLFQLPNVNLFYLIATKNESTKCEQ